MRGTVEQPACRPGVVYVAGRDESRQNEAAGAVEHVAHDPQTFFLPSMPCTPACDPDTLRVGDCSLGLGRSAVSAGRGSGQIRWPGSGRATCVPSPRDQSRTAGSARGSRSSPRCRRALTISRRRQRIVACQQRRHPRPLRVRHVTRRATTLIPVSLTICVRPPRLLFTKPTRHSPAQSNRL